MGGDLSMPDMSACEQSLRKTFDGFENLFSKAETPENQEIEIRYQEYGDSFMEINYREPELQELSFRIKGYVFRLYAKKFNVDLINNFLETIKRVDNVIISCSIAGLYKPPAMGDDEDEPKFFEIKDSTISEDYTKCTSKKFYLIFKEDIENEDDLKEKIKEDIKKKKEIFAIKIQKIFRDYSSRKPCSFLSSCIESTGDNTFNSEKNNELDSDDEGIIIGEDNSSNNSGDDNVVVKSNLGSQNKVIKISENDKKEIDILRQRISNNPRKSKNCKNWQNNINTILAKYSL